MNKSFFKWLIFASLVIILIPSCNCNDEKVDLGPYPFYSFSMSFDYIKDGQSIIENTPEFYNSDMTFAKQHDIKIESSFGDKNTTILKGEIKNKNCYLTLSLTLISTDYNQRTLREENDIKIKLDLPFLGENHSETISAKWRIKKDWTDWRDKTELYDIYINGELISETELPYYTISLD